MLYTNYSIQQIQIQIQMKLLTAKNGMRYTKKLNGQTKIVSGAPRRSNKNRLVGVTRRSSKNGLTVRRRTVPRLGLGIGRRRRAIA